MFLRPRGPDRTGPDAPGHRGNSPRAVASLRWRHNSPVLLPPPLLLRANSNRHANQRRRQIRSPDGRPGVWRVDLRRIRRNCCRHAPPAVRAEIRGRVAVSMPAGRRQRAEHGHQQGSARLTHYRHDEAVLCDHPITPELLVSMLQPADCLPLPPPTCYLSLAINNAARFVLLMSVQTTRHHDSTLVQRLTADSTQPTGPSTTACNQHYRSCLHKIKSAVLLYFRH